MIPSWTHDRRVRMCFFALIILLGALCLLSPWTGARKWTLQEAMNDRAGLLVDDAMKKNLVVFATVSSIKAVVALIEGSTVGVGFHLQLGDLVQPAYDYVDFVWRLFLYAVLVMTFYKQLIESGVLGTGTIILGAGLFIWGIACLSGFGGILLRQWSRRLVILGLVVAYGVPAILLSSNFISQRYTAPLKQRTAEEIAQQKQRFFAARQEFLALRDKVSLSRPGESLEAIRTSIFAVVDEVTQTAWDSVGTMLYYVSILIFDLLFLPFLMALLVYFVFHVSFARIQSRFTQKQVQQQSSPAQA